MAYTTRLGQPSDVEVLVDFNRRLARETEARELDATVLRAGVAAALADSEKATYVLATAASGDVVGGLMLTKEWSDWRNGELWWIQSVYVETAHRRRGVFRQLYAQARRTAQAAGAVGLRLYVEHENATARDTYTSLGMNDAGYTVMEDVW